MLIYVILVSCNIAKMSIEAFRSFFASKMISSLALSLLTLHLEITP
jgi:hypothetical protein